MTGIPAFSKASTSSVAGLPFFKKKVSFGPTASATLAAAGTAAAGTAATATLAAAAGASATLAAAGAAAAASVAVPETEYGGAVRDKSSGGAVFLPDTSIPFTRGIFFAFSKSARRLRSAARVA